MPEVRLQGFIIDGGGHRSDPRKTAAIDNMAVPQNVSEVRSFLGMKGYHKNPIPNYAALAEPLVALTKKHARYAWGDREPDALRGSWVSDRVMAHPKVDRPYKLYTDASNYAMGAGR